MELLILLTICQKMFFLSSNTCCSYSCSGCTSLSYMYGSHFHFGNIYATSQIWLMFICEILEYCLVPLLFSLSHWRLRLTFLYIPIYCMYKGCPIAVRAWRHLCALVKIRRNSEMSAYPSISIYQRVRMRMLLGYRNLCGNNSSSNTLLRASSSW